MQIERNEMRRLKEKLDQELEEERHIRETLTLGLRKLREETKLKERARLDLEVTHSNLVAENDVLKLDVEAAKRDISELLTQSQGTLDDLQNRL